MLEVQNSTSNPTVYTENKLSLDDISSKAGDAQIRLGDKGPGVLEFNELIEERRKTDPEYDRILARVQGKPTSERIPVDQFLGPKSQAGLIALREQLKIAANSEVAIDSKLLAAMTAAPSELTSSQQLEMPKANEVSVDLSNTREEQKALNTLIRRSKDLRTAATERGFIPKDGKLEVDGIVGSKTRGVSELVETLGLESRFEVLLEQQSINNLASEIPDLKNMLVEHGLTNSKGFLVEDGFRGEKTFQAAKFAEQFIETMPYAEVEDAMTEVPASVGVAERMIPSSVEVGFVEIRNSAALSLPSLGNSTAGKASSTIINVDKDFSYLKSGYETTSDIQNSSVFVRDLPAEVISQVKLQHNNFDWPVIEVMDRDNNQHLIGGQAIYISMVNGELEIVAGPKVIETTPDSELVASNFNETRIKI